MQRLKLLALAALAGSLAAQSNTVAGLDGRIVSIDQLTYQGRRGAAYPNGEVGLSMLNFMCNPGSVNIPWFAAMAPDHPKFGFIITRLSAGRMVQISDWSYVKHAFASINGSGTCGTCQNPGTSAQMGVHCDDTYQASHNADRYNLGPPSEIDPWLGTWNPVGSYFDRGDPPVGAAQQVDGVRSLTGTMTSAFDAVKNRITVKEQDLSVPGASYYYGIKLIHQGEAGANRGDNIASRGFTPVGSASGWSTNNNGVGLLYGSILGHWTGATLDNASNGPDDGFFYVAVNVTGPVAGVYHYEYAVHNVDNNRGSAGLHIPLAPGSTVTGLGFRDIDSNALNDWTGSINASEIAFTAPAGNPQNWNTIYNFWFDCNVAPSLGQVLIDEARVGPGQLQVAVNARVPSGVPTATVASIGTGCVDCSRSFYEEFTSPSGMDLGGHTMVLTLNGANYTVSSGSPTYVAPSGSATNLGLGDDSRATVTLPFSFPYPGGTTTTLSVCSNGFISPGINADTAYNPDVTAFLGGVLRWAPSWHDFFPDATHNVMVDSSASMVRVTWNNVPDYVNGVGVGNSTMQVQFLPSGTINFLWQSMTGQGSGYLVGYTPGGGANDPGNSDLSVRVPAGFSVCQVESLPLALGSATRPIIGTTIGLNTTNIPGGTQFGALQLSFAEQSPPLDLSSIGMPGCFSYTLNAFQVGGLWIAPVSSHMVSIPIPNQNSLIGAIVYTQSATFGPPLTPLGAIASNGLVLTLGL